MMMAVSPPQLRSGCDAIKAHFCAAQPYTFLAADECVCARAVNGCVINALISRRAHAAATTQVHLTELSCEPLKTSQYLCTFARHVCACACCTALSRFGLHTCACVCVRVLRPHLIKDIKYVFALRR